jgi:ribosomal protein S18 acetylase RimI-like enzyme
MKSKLEISKVSLRPATEADSEFAYQVLKTAFGGYVALAYGWDEQQQRELHQRRFRPSGTWIIKYDDKEVGLLAIDREPNQIRIRQLFLMPDFQGCGIGVHLMKDILKESEHKWCPVKLQVLKVNNRAKAFFERMGFTVIGETETHYQMEYES